MQNESKLANLKGASQGIYLRCCLKYLSSFIYTI
jgi:hypothetical protein